MHLKDDQTIPVWNNTTIYKDLSDSQIKHDCDEISQLIVELKEVTGSLLEKPENNNTIGQITEALELYNKAVIQIWTIAVFASCISSVDRKNEPAAKLEVRVGELDSQINQAFKPLKSFILKAGNEFQQQLFDKTSATQFSFFFNSEKKMLAHELDTGEEVAVAALSSDGLHGWGRLYSELSGSLRCTIDGEEMGLAAAFNLTCQADPVKRRNAWKAIQHAWHSREETAAAILNAINGWRHQEQKLRSAKTPLHFLDVSCHDQQIEKETLLALMKTTENRKALGHRALKGMAKGLGLEKLGPQDLLAPCPSESEDDSYYSFAEAIDLVSDAFESFDQEMGDFARMMYQQGWIDAKPTDNRSTGAYCTQFDNVREPRIFMTWDGSSKNVITLAHELGHAWHNWVMKDIPYFETRYPSTLAETASIFAETIVRDALFNQAKSDQEKLEIAWEDAESAAAFLVNIPARFEFEKRLAKARADSYLPAAELSRMMEESWAKWYEDSISEYDPMFWASKLHFSISGMSFYNYPYLFGYLFSLGVYAQKEKQGQSFRQAYIEILKDTGRMTSEELIMKHLSKDIRQEAFWNDSLDIVEGLITRFEGLLEKVE